MLNAFQFEFSVHHCHGDLKTTELALSDSRERPRCRRSIPTTVLWACGGHKLHRLHQRKIRQDHSKSTEARNVEVSAECVGRNWRAPVGLVHGYFDFSGREINVTQRGTSMNLLSELRQHMEYGRGQQEQGDTPGEPAAGPAQVGAESDESDPAEDSKKRDRDEDDDVLVDSTDRNGGGKRRSLTRSRSSPLTDELISRTGHKNSPARASAGQ